MHRNRASPSVTAHPAYAKVRPCRLGAFHSHSGQHPWVPPRTPPTRWSRALARAAAALGVGLLAALLLGAAPADGPRMRSFFVQVAEAPGSSARIPLDVDLYLPATTPAPAVLLAHGFGQTKADLASEARRLQREGYVVLTYSARGFGRSGGSIGLDSLDG
jgi:ABC-2 type transport system ATP-binding protein